MGRVTPNEFVAGNKTEPIQKPEILIFLSSSLGDVSYGFPLPLLFAFAFSG
jgi:hypothetical protein